MRFLPVFKKELKSYITSPVIYVVLTVFLVISGYFFYSNLLMVVMFQGTNVRVDLWEYTFNDIRFILLIMIPLVSMRVFAEEKKLGTIELLFTSPLRDLEIILGKYYACLAVLALMLFLTFLYPVLFQAIYHLDRGPVFAGYLGLFLLGALFLACGMFISSRTENQIIAAIVTLGILLFFWFIDRYEGIGAGLILNTLTHLSLQKHFYNFNRGVINTKDIVYFVTVCAVFLFLTLRSLELRHREQSTARIPGAKELDVYWLRIAGKVLFCVVILISLNVVAVRLNQRFDLTPGKLFTLSPAADRAVKSLKDELNVTVFYEKGERYQYEELLDLMSQSSANFKYTLLNLNRNLNKAQVLGIESSGAGVAEYKDRREIIPSVTEAGLVKAVLTLTQGRKKTVRFIGSYEEGNSEGKNRYQDIKTALKADGFKTEHLKLTSQGEVPADTLILAVSGQKGDLSEQELNAIGNFFENGGQVLFQLDPARLPRISRFLEKYNIDIADDIIVDREHTSAELDELTPVIFLNREHPISANVSAPVIFPRARSVQVGANLTSGLSWTIIAQSGRRTWAERDMQSAYDGTAEYSGEDGDVYGPVSAGVIVKKREKGGQGKTGGGMIVLGNSTFITDENLNILGNRDFFMSVIKWLAEQGSPLADLPQPRAVPIKPFIRLTERENRLFFWSAVVVEPLLIFCTGALVFLWRKIKS